MAAEKIHHIGCEGNFSALLDDHLAKEPINEGAVKKCREAPISENISKKVEEEVEAAKKSDEEIAAVPAKCNEKQAAHTQSLPNRAAVFKEKASDKPAKISPEQEAVNVIKHVREAECHDQSTSLSASSTFRERSKLVLLAKKLLKSKVKRQVGTLIQRRLDVIVTQRFDDWWDSHEKLYDVVPVPAMKKASPHSKDKSTNQASLPSYSNEAELKLVLPEPVPVAKRCKIMSENKNVKEAYPYSSSNDEEIALTLPDPVPAAKRCKIMAVSKEIQKDKAKTSSKPVGTDKGGSKDLSSQISLTERLMKIAEQPPDCVPFFMKEFRREYLQSKRKTPRPPSNSMSSSVVKGIPIMLTEDDRNAATRHRRLPPDKENTRSSGMPQTGNTFPKGDIKSRKLCAINHTRYAATQTMDPTEKLLRGLNISPSRLKIVSQPRPRDHTASKEEPRKSELPEEHAEEGRAMVGFVGQTRGRARGRASLGIDRSARAPNPGSFSGDFQRNFYDYKKATDFTEAAYEPSHNKHSESVIKAKGRAVPTPTGRSRWLYQKSSPAPPTSLPIAPTGGRAFRRGVNRDETMQRRAYTTSSSEDDESSTAGQASNPSRSVERESTKGRGEKNVLPLHGTSGASGARRGSKQFSTFTISSSEAEDDDQATNGSKSS